MALPPVHFTFQKDCSVLSWRKRRKVINRGDMQKFNSPDSQAHSQYYSISCWIADGSGCKVRKDSKASHSLS